MDIYIKSIDEASSCENVSSASHAGDKGTNLVLQYIYENFFIHVYCRIGWQYIYELVSHEKSYEEAKKFMENVRIFHEAGWTAVLNYK